MHYYKITLNKNGWSKFGLFFLCLLRRQEKSSIELSRNKIEVVFYSNTFIDVKSLLAEVEAIK
jgi:hypothetical protein